ncbi:hypothetical protein [Roseovarius salinarum]|uniref:hypothetical protein n=1 Tax=Roseovarius salinarum TaxID=1981892 RepID=UPI000C31E92A|nr:hypothetical protein [Roseovarius salinarum]
MTALSEYQRLEASGLWRESPQAQRCDVIVSIGDATLVITDLRERVLAHWSLPAVARANPGHLPAIYHPDGDPGETLELPADETDMIAAIEKLRTAIDRRRPHPGRLRLTGGLLVLLGLAVLAVFWLPGAVRDHAVSVVPAVKRTEIGQALLAQMRPVTGPPCTANGGEAALDKLARRLPARAGPGRIVVLRGGVRQAAHLPGGLVLLNRSLVEDYEEPDVAAGYIVAERLRARVRDPLARLLDHGGLVASLRLLTTGELATETLSDHAHHLLQSAPAPLPDETLLRGFEGWSVRARPYAYARDVSGETTLGLIEADPFAGKTPDPLLSDGDWLRLQGICGT